MPKFELNKRTLQFEISKKQVPTNAEVLARVKRIHRATIHLHEIQDKDLTSLMDRIRSGTRNVNYLSLPNVTTDMRIRAIFHFLLREME